MHSRDDCFCVLGVLADLAVKDGVDSWRAEGSVAYVVGAIGAACFLPREITEWSGLDQVPRDDSKCSVETVLMRMNDSEKRSFDQLADYIEEHF